MELIRSPLARVVEQGERLFLFSPGGAVRRFDGASALLAKTVLEALDVPKTREQLLEAVSEVFDGVTESPNVVDDLLEHFKAAGVVDADTQRRELPMPIAGVRIALLSSGAVATAFLPDLVVQLQQLGAEVRVGLSRAARRFVEPRALEALTHHAAFTSHWESAPDAPAPHIQLAEWADAVVVAPASATTLSRVARGDCTDLISATVVATRAPVLLAPSMNPNMLRAPAVRRNLAKLSDDGHFVCWPSSGPEVAHEPAQRRLVRGPMLPPKELAALVAAWVPQVARVPPPSTARFWDTAYRLGEVPWQRDDLDAALRAVLEKLPRGRLLDVGAGLGTVAAAAAQLGFEVIATDVSRVALDEARKRNPSARVTWVEDDLLRSRLLGTFEVVVDRAVLHVLPWRDHLAYARFLSEHVAPGGVALIAAHGPQTPATLRTTPFRREDVEALLGASFAIEAAHPISITGATGEDATLFVLRRS